VTDDTADATDAPGARVRELVLASAGSGKTFRISSRIIALLADGEPPATILASTFTRKAAGEILDRVLVRLARAASDDAWARQLAEHTGGPPGGPASDAARGPAFWREVLSRTVSQLHRLDIGTLDSFFVRAVGSFAHDLGLPPGWGIADRPTEDRLRSEALDEVLEDTDKGALLELLRGLSDGSTRRSVHDALTRTVDDLLRVHRALKPGTPGWSALTDALPDLPEDVAARAAALADRLAASEVPRTKAGSPDKRWLGARDKDADKLREGDWTGFLSAGLGTRVVGAEEEPTYYGTPFPAPLLAVVREAVELARVVVGAELARRGEAMGRLAEAYDEAYMARLRSAGMLRFEDVTRFLLGPRPLTGRDDLAYRMDGRARHLLLDEFQDTSVLQWRALTPLADDLVGEAGDRGGGATVVVADPKQSIYGWRGAAPGVVEALGDRYGLPQTSMAKSWRSSQVVLDAVNRVFDGIHRTAALERDAVRADEARRWEKAFEPHVAANDLPGHVVLAAGPEREGTTDAQPELSRFVARRIAALHRGAPDRTIGVLTRKNDEVGRLIFELGALGVRASEEGGTSLLDSAAVVSLLALLRLADHPGDGLARYHVAETPVGPAVGLDDRRSDRQAGRVSHQLRRDLMERGFGRTLGDLAARLAGDCDARERLRLRRLVELGYRWDEGPGAASPRVDDFVRLAEAERAESPGRSPVRVMTVHQAKGLEFDAVVLPQLHLRMSGGRTDTSALTYRPGGVGPVTHAFPYVKSALVPLLSDVPELEEARRQRASSETRDALGGLYVAMTRARYALHMVVPAGTGPTGSPAALLREALSPLPADEEVEEGRVLYEAGDDGWHATAPRRDAREGAAPPPPETIRLRSGPRTRLLERRSPSSAEGGDRVRAAELLGLRHVAGARTRGTLVHAWLETLEWIEDGLAPQEELDAIARRAAPSSTPEEVERILGWLRARLAEPDVRRALSRELHRDGAEVERELPFLIREGDALVEGFIDRLVLEHEGGRVTSATVVDYKTDRLDPDHPDGLEGALRARALHYRPQLQAYRRAVADLYGLELDDVEGRLLFLDAGSVQRVD